MGPEGGYLCGVLGDGAPDEGFVEVFAGVVDDVAGGEVVGAVEDEVVLVDDVEGVVVGELFVVLVDGGVGVEVVEGVGG